MAWVWHHLVVFAIHVENSSWDGTYVYATVRAPCTLYWRLHHGGGDSTYIIHNHTFFELLPIQFALPTAHTKSPVLTHSLFSLMLFLSECLRQHCQPLSRQLYVGLVGFACPFSERLYDVIWCPFAAAVVATLILNECPWMHWLGSHQCWALSGRV